MLESRSNATMGRALDDRGDFMRRARVVGQVLLVFVVALAPFWFFGQSMAIVFAFLLAGAGFSLLRH